MDLKPIGRLVTMALVLGCAACNSALITSTPAVAPTLPSASDLLVTPGVSASPVSEGLVAALVNGQPIYLEDYERKLGQYEASLPAWGVDPNTPEGQEALASARAYVLDVMIEQVLIEQAAAAAGISVPDEEVDAYMQAMIEENGGLEAFEAKLAEIGDTYENARREVRSELIGMAMTRQVIGSVPTVAEHVHARHILLDTYEEAANIHARLEAGADFATLAREYSKDPNTRDSGGDLGFFPRGILTAPEVEEAAFSLQPGQFSGIVPSVLGYHIVQVVERDPAREISPENLSLLQDRVLQEWIEGLWAQAEIQRFIAP